MSYVDKHLRYGEKAVYKAHIHWYIFVPGILMLVIGLCLVYVVTANAILMFVGLILVLVSMFSLVKAIIIKFTTELAVTSKRIIAKIGLSRRNTIKLNHSKVESFNVNQSIIGRLFGFGTIIVNDTDGGKTPIPCIDSPLEFRREAMQTIDNNE